MCTAESYTHPCTDFGGHLLKEDSIPSPSGICLETLSPHEGGCPGGHRDDFTSLEMVAKTETKHILALLEGFRTQV